MMAPRGAQGGWVEYQFTCRPIPVPIRRAKPSDVMVMEYIALVYDFGALSIVFRESEGWMERTSSGFVGITTVYISQIRGHRFRSPGTHKKSILDGEEGGGRSSAESVL